MQCSDCHVHNEHTGFAPQGTDQEILCKTCHITGGWAGDKAGVALHDGGTDCTDCHEIHDTGEDLGNPAGVLWTTDWRDGTTAENQNWVRGNVDLYMPGPKKSLVAAATPVIWHDGSAEELADPTGSDTNAAGKLDRLCQACHTNPTATTDYHTNDPSDPWIQPTDPVFGYTHPANLWNGTAGQDCRECHSHSEGFAPSIEERDCLAGGCHDTVQGAMRQIGESSPGAGDGDFGTGMTSHHVNDGTGYQIADHWDCIACHAEGRADGGGVTTYHFNGTVDLKNADDAVTAYTDGNAVYVGWITLAPEARSDFCLSCHDADGATIITTRTEPDPEATTNALNPFNDGVTNHHEPDGFDGTAAPHPRYRPEGQSGYPDPGVVDVKSQFYPENVSHHAVLGPAYGTGSTPLTSAPGGNLAGAVFGTDAHGNSITWESRLNCEDCHVDTDREGVNVGLVGHGSVNARYMLKDAYGADFVGIYDPPVRTLNCFACHDPQASGGTGILSNYPKHVGRDGDHMLDGNNLYGIACLNCHGGGYPAEYLDGGIPTVYLTDGIPFGAIHGVPLGVPTPDGHKPNIFTYGSALANISNWIDLDSPSCGAINPLTVLNNCTNHSGSSQGYTRSYSRSYRGP
jgi:hypothetical protein